MWNTCWLLGVARMLLLGVARMLLLGVARLVLLGVRVAWCVSKVCLVLCKNDDVLLCILCYLGTAD